MHEPSGATARRRRVHVDGLRQSQAVDGMNEEESVRGFHFVATERADEVPTNRWTARYHLSERLLNAVLADVLKSGAPGRGHGVRPVRFGDGDDRDLLPMPAAFHGLSDSLPHLGEAVRQVLEWHNTLKYQGLQVVSSETMSPLFRAR